MIGEAQAQMRTITGEILPLQSVSAKGRLQGLVFELEVEQTYRNTEAEAIEVVYTFPVPARATLMGLEVTIGEKVLRGVAVRRQKASEDYEAAIEEGNTAVLLEQSLDGAFTVSLGNLPGGETATIRYRYAELVDSFRDCIRLRVPTVIAPWYGDPQATSLQPHQIWSNDPVVEYPFTIEIDILDELSTCQINVPSHDTELLDIENGRRVRTVGRVSLDRDFVINITGEITREQSAVCPDGEGWIAMASLVVPRLQQEPRPLALKFLVDCSGSMGGPSIAQARQALLLAAERLHPGDQVSLTRFGSTFQHLTPGMVRAGEGEVERFRRLVSGMDADLGGTEMAEAVAATVQIPGGGETTDVLLITDGQIFDFKDVIRKVESSGHRLFVVSVGSAPVEVLGRELAERTGGSWESVAPGEDSTGTIVRMFKRLREPAQRLESANWPIEPIWEAASQQAVYGDDTLHLFARFASQPAGGVTATLSSNDAPDLRITVPVGHQILDNERIPRLAAGAYAKTLAEDQAAKVAEQYQLAGPYTSYLLINEDSRLAGDSSLPQLRKVATMVPAGWGGSAHLHMHHTSTLTLNVQIAECRQEKRCDYLQPPLSIPDFLRPQEESSDIPANTKPPKDVLDAIAQSQDAFKKTEHLKAIGVPNSQLILLEDTGQNTGVPIRLLIAVWIAVLVDILDPAFMAPDQKIRCQQDYLKLRSLRQVRQACRRGLAGVQLDAWPK